ncbi:MAG: NAD-dependent epimerase/dehydratase family protein [Promethearchaeota archaeon]
MVRVLVTGGAGFIGSHLVDLLSEDHEVTVLDNLSTGAIENLQKQARIDSFVFIKGSITSDEDLERSMQDVTTVFHFAAQPDVRLSVQMPLLDFNVNVAGGLKLLEMMRKSDVKRIVFASSGGTIYGDTEVLPTPESTSLNPISNYGAAKAAFEMYLSSYSELYGFHVVSARFANVIGPRLTHGVVYDFYMKLKDNPDKLEVLGNGKQEKVYVYISDAVEATALLANRLGPGFLPVNVGSRDSLKVSCIAEIVLEELGFRNDLIEYTGGSKGWTGDVKRTAMDIGLLESLGWRAKVSAEDGIRQYLQWLVKEYGPVK